jgi:hypothetical protein
LAVLLQLQAQQEMAGTPLVEQMAMEGQAMLLPEQALVAVDGSPRDRIQLMATAVPAGRRHLHLRVVWALPGEVRVEMADLVVAAVPCAEPAVAAAIQVVEAVREARAVPVAVEEAPTMPVHHNLIPMQYAAATDR